MTPVRAASVVAQCKVNLFLRVLARESGGHHQLETLFCRLALGDGVTVRATGGERTLDMTGAALPTGGVGPTERNLAWRAALAYASAAGWPKGFAIEIDKRIPVGGGLGGGSADAGAVLRCLNALAPAPMPPDALLRIGAMLGADVPFLTQDVSPLALAWGRGDRMLTLPSLPSRRCVLVCFPFGVSTTDAYGWLTESPADSPTAVAYAPESLASWEVIERLAYNEFERVVTPHLPPLAAGLAALRQGRRASGGDIVLLSGSGSTVFVLPGASGAQPGDHGEPEGRQALSPRATTVEGARSEETSTSASVEPVRLRE